MQVAASMHLMATMPRNRTLALFEWYLPKAVGIYLDTLHPPPLTIALTLTVIDIAVVVDTSAARLRTRAWILR
jgi:hypothetical protein